MEVTTETLAQTRKHTESDESLTTNDSEDGFKKKTSQPRINNEGKEAELLFYKNPQRTRTKETEPKYLLTDFITDGGIKQKQDKYKDSRNFISKGKNKTMRALEPQSHQELLKINKAEESPQKNKTFTCSLSQRKNPNKEYKDTITKTEQNNSSHYNNYKAINTNNNNKDNEQSKLLKRMKDYMVPVPKKKAYCLTEVNMTDQDPIKNRKDRGQERDKEDDLSQTEKKQKTIEELTEKYKIIAMHNIQSQLENEKSKKSALELEKKIGILTHNNINIDSEEKEIEEEPLNELHSETKKKENKDDDSIHFKQEKADDSKESHSDKKKETEGNKEQEQGEYGNDIKDNLKKEIKTKANKELTPVKPIIIGNRNRDYSGNNRQNNPSIQTKEYLREICKYLPSQRTERLQTYNSNDNEKENHHDSFRETQHKHTIDKKQPQLFQKEKRTLIYDEDYNMIIKPNKRPLKSEEEFNVIINEKIRKEKELKKKKEEDQQKKFFSQYEKIKALIIQMKKGQSQPLKKKNKTKVQNEFYQGRHKHSKQSSSHSTQIDHNDYLNTILNTNKILNSNHRLTESTNDDVPISKENYDKFLNENEEKTKQGNIGAKNEYNDKIKQILLNISKGKKKKKESKNDSKNNESSKKESDSDRAILPDELNDKVQKTIETNNELLSKENLPQFLFDDKNMKEKSRDTKAMKDSQAVSTSEKSKNNNNKENQLKKPKKNKQPVEVNNSKAQTIKIEDKGSSLNNEEINQHKEKQPIKAEHSFNEAISDKDRLNTINVFVETVILKYNGCVKRNVYPLICFYAQKRVLYVVIQKVNCLLNQQKKKRFNQYYINIQNKALQEEEKNSMERLSDSNDSIVEVKQQKEEEEEAKQKAATEQEGKKQTKLLKTIDDVFIKPIKATVLLQLFDFADKEDIHYVEQDNQSDSQSKPLDSLRLKSENQMMKLKEEEAQNVSVSNQNQTYLYESFEDKQSVLVYPNSAESDRLHRLCELMKKQRESMNNESSHSDSFNVNYQNRSQQSAYYQDLSQLSYSNLSMGYYTSKSSRSLKEIVQMKPKRAFKKHLDEIISPSSELNVLSKGLSSSDKEIDSYPKMCSKTNNKLPPLERKESNEGDISADKDITSNIDWEYNLTNKGSNRETERQTSGKVVKEQQPLILEEFNNDAQVKTHNRELSLENKINAIEIRDQISEEEEVHFHTKINSDFSDANEYNNAKFDDLDSNKYISIKYEDNDTNQKKDDLFVFILEEDGKTDSNIFIEGTETITQGLIRNQENVNLLKKYDHNIKDNNRYDYDEYDRQIDQRIRQKQAEEEAEDEIMVIDQHQPPIDYSPLTKLSEKQVLILINDIVNSVIEKEMGDLNISLLPKKRTLSRKEQEIQISRSDSFGSSPSSPKGKLNLREDDFSSSSLLVANYGNSALMRTIVDIKKQVCLSIYNAKIAPLLINQIAIEIKKNYQRIYNQISQPILKYSELLMIGIQLKDDRMISESQGHIPYHNIPFISKDFLREFNQLNKKKRNEENVIEDNYYDYMMNELLVDAANEIIECERHYGEVGSPLPWSIRSREVEYKYQNDDCSCQKLQEVVTHKLRALTSFNMGLISENHEHFDVDQLNQNREKKFLRSITEELLQEEPVWKGLEKEETEVKLILNKVIMEQLLNEVVEILEHVQLSRKEPSIYQYKSIYSCEDIPRLSFQNHNYIENSMPNQSNPEE